MIVRRPRTIYLVKRLEALSKTLLDEALRDLDLTPSQYATLSLLGSQTHISSAELARRVVVTPQSMSEMINALERKGLVERYENAANRRVLHIHLSEAGRVLLEQADVRVDGLETELFSGLNNGEVAVLRGLVSRALGVGRDVPNG